MKELDELFEQWKKLVSEEQGHFNEDGVICRDGWTLANKKILFILKETNDYQGNIANLINEAVTTRPKSKLWSSPAFHNIGRWAYGLLNFSESVPSYKEAHKKRRKSLLSCSFINIKKTTGGRTATKSVEESAKKYSKFLKTQIELLQPDIIVFGGTYRIIKDHVLPEMTKVSFRVHKYKKTTCINANHPSCTKKRKEMYDQVIVSYGNYMSDTINA